MKKKPLITDIINIVLLPLFAFMAIGGFISMTQIGFNTRPIDNETFASGLTFFVGSIGVLTIVSLINLNQTKKND